MIEPAKDAEDPVPKEKLVKTKKSGAAKYKAQGEKSIKKAKEYYEETKKTKGTSYVYTILAVIGVLCLILLPLVLIAIPFILICLCVCVYCVKSATDSDSEKEKEKPQQTVIVQ